MLQHYGLMLGLALVAAVTALALALGRQAARGVEQFREEHHESFTERGGR